ncbi:hypothetical protein PIB30_114124, partial [Stylosanthes scabra]|nr:hypothetical protein [Stylosanthes scabra]
IDPFSDLLYFDLLKDSIEILLDPHFLVGTISTHRVILLDPVHLPESLLCLRKRKRKVFERSPCSVLPHVRVPPATFGASVSSQAASVPVPAVPAVPNPPPAATDKGRSSKDPVGKPFPVQGEEG